MKINAGDYLVLKPEPGSKKFNLLKVTKVKEELLAGTLESFRKGLSVDSVEIDRKSVLLNLGARPAPGKVYGLDLTNRYRSRIEHPFWGNVLVFTGLDKATGLLVKQSLDRTARRIEKMGLSSYVELVDTHLCAKQGKWAGRYHHNGNGADSKGAPHFIQYAPEYAELKPDSMDYVVYHEFGHVVRHNGVTGKKIRLKWLNEYKKTIDSFEIGRGSLKTLFNHLSSRIDGDTTLSAVLKEFGDEDEEHKLWIKGLLRWFKDVHHFGPKDLSVIWDSQELGVLKELWPANGIDSSKLSPLVTEYACLNVEELFGEAFAFYCLNKKLPSRIQTLLEGSIQYAKAQASKS